MQDRRLSAAERQGNLGRNSAGEVKKATFGTGEKLIAPSGVVSQKGLGAGQRVLPLAIT
jgi:hypothetical protein